MSKRRITIEFTDGKKETAYYPHITDDIRLDAIGYGKAKLYGVKSVTIFYGEWQGSFTINN